MIRVKNCRDEIAECANRGIATRLMAYADFTPYYLGSCSIYYGMDSEHPYYLRYDLIQCIEFALN